MNYLAKLINILPGWMYTFFNDIIANNKIAFIKDTTMIVHIRTLSVNQVTILFEVLKELNQIGVIKKVLNKKEYLVIHFYSLDVTAFFVNPNKWMSLALYNDCLVDETDMMIDYYIDREYDLKISNGHKTIFLYTSVKVALLDNEYYLDNHLNNKIPIDKWIKYNNQHEKILEYLKKILSS